MSKLRRVYTDYRCFLSEENRILVDYELNLCGSCIMHKVEYKLKKKDENLLLEFKLSYWPTNEFVY